MHMTDNSYINFASQLPCINPIKQTKLTNNILKGLFRDIKDGETELKYAKSINKHFYMRNVMDIANKSQIPKPKTFNDASFPPEVLKNIMDVKKVKKKITYSINIFNRNIHINFIAEKKNVTLKTYDSYVDNILIWLYIVNKYANIKCATSLTLFFYQTNLIKELPVSNMTPINQINANSAFTRSCQTNAEIVIFRNEEWFKVFIHESMHTFGLDFSGINSDYCTKMMLSLFKLQSDVNLYEAYTEFWARIMNVLFCSYNTLKQEQNIHGLNEITLYNKLNNLATNLIHIEIKFAFFNMVKILNLMDLKYNDIIENFQIKYKENTNVLSYYIITTILLNNYQLFLSWCNRHNNPLLQFSSDISEQYEFCKFIYSKYRSKCFLDRVKCMEKIIDKNNKTQTNKNNLLLKSLRMSVCEMG